jgi:plasmid replication initiation protein
MKIRNKDMIQSYIMTVAKYDFSADEKRILLRLVETLQHLVEGKELRGKIRRDLFGYFLFEFPISYFVPENQTNYNRIRDALRALNEKKFEYEDDKRWEIIRIVEKPVVENREKVTFELNPKLAECFLNFTKGYRIFELETCFSFSSVYAMRFYELLSGQKSPLTYTIERLKEMFQITDKYKLARNFIEKVIVPAKRELDEKSPYSFEYAINKHGKRFHSITFYPVSIPKNRDEDVERVQLVKQLPTAFKIGDKEVQYLRDMGFTNAQIKNNHSTFVEAASLLPDFLFEMSILKGKMRGKNNPQGWVINALKGKIKDIKAIV